MRRTFGLIPDQRYELWASLRHEGVPDATIARVFGVTRQTINQRLGRRFTDEISPELIEEIRAQLELGANVRQLSLATGRRYSQVEAVAEQLGYPSKRRKEIQARIRRKWVKSQLQIYLDKGYPLTSINLRRWDALEPRSGLFFAATEIQSLPDWRRELGVEASTPLHVVHVITRK